MGEVSRPQPRSVNQLVGLVVLHISSTIRRLFGWLHTIVCYYRKSFSFALTDTLLWVHYILASPYRISRFFSTKNLYGETPLATLDKIVRKSRLLSHDVAYEIGCGTGRTCFWLHHFVKCRVVGVEHVPLFVGRAQRIVSWRNLDRITFKAEDVLKTPMHDATWIYFYGTARETSFIHALCDKFMKLSPKVRIVTTSYGLNEYDDRFESEFLCRATFPWGRADVFMNSFAAIR